MDYNGAEPIVDLYGDDGTHNQYEDEEYPQEMYSAQQQHHQQQQHYPHGDYDSNVDDSSARRELKNSNDDSSAGKLFVGGIAWETNEESFTKYFSKYGEISDSVIMMDKVTGRPRGFGFVTFADSEVTNRVLEEDHVIDGRTVEVKRTVPREDMQTKGVMRTKKIFIGGIPISLSEDDLREYFSAYGKIIEHQIMLDRNTGRSRGFGFVTFETEDAVERIFSDGRMHELDGKRVEIKRAEPKRAGFDQGQENRMRRGGGSSKSYGSFGGDQTEFGGGYGGKMGRGYGGYSGYGGGYGGYGGYPGNFSGAATGFYPGYGGYGYGFGFGGPMYGGGGGAGYGGGGYGNPAGYGVSGGYGGGKGYGGTSYGGGGGSGSASSYGGPKGYGAGGGSGSGGGASKGYGSGGAPSGRFHPYRK